MSTIEEVSAAEKKVQKVLDALKKADARDANDLSAELQKATDEYARAVRELSSKKPTTWSMSTIEMFCQQSFSDAANFTVFIDLPVLET